MASSNDRFLRACRRLPVDRVPVWFMRQAGRYMKEYRKLRERHSILEIAKTPELACAVTLQPVRAFPVDAAILFSDILLPLEPMGVKVRFAPGPVIDNPARTAAAIRRLRVYDPREGLPCVGRAAALVRRELGGDIPLIGFAGAPFTLASYLVEGGPTKDFVRVKAMMHEAPLLWDELMDKLVGVVVGSLRAQAEAGAQALQLFDSWAGALSPAQYRRFALPHSRRVFRELKPLGVPLIHFGTGTAGFLEDFASAGGQVVGVDWRVDLGEAFRRVGGRAVQGNLDPALLLGPRQALKAAVREVLAQARGRRGYVFNLGHGILPKTPVENVRAVADWVHAWRPN